TYLKGRPVRATTSRLDVKPATYNARSGAREKRVFFSTNPRFTALHAPSVMSTRAFAAPTRFRSKTLTALLAFLLGSVGAHRFYLYGPRDPFGWAHVLGTALGIPSVLL